MTGIQVPEAELWARVDPDVRARAVEVLRSELHPDTQAEIRELIEIDGPEDWMPPAWHFSGGMEVRNILRRAGLTDDKLPGYDEWYGPGTDVRNWDDYYNAALVEAVTN